MGQLMNALMGVSIVNILLLLSVGWVHVRALQKTKSSFAFGLLLFEVLLLLQNAFSLYYFVTMMPLFVAGLEPYVLSFNVLQLFALITLNWVMWK